MDMKRRIKPFKKRTGPQDKVSAVGMLHSQSSHLSLAPSNAQLIDTVRNFYVIADHIEKRPLLSS